MTWQEHALTSTPRDQVPFITLYSMCVCRLFDWLAACTRPSVEIAHPQIIPGTLLRNAFRFSFCLHTWVWYLRQLPSGLVETRAAPGRERRKPLLALLHTLLTRQCTMMLVSTASACSGTPDVLSGTKYCSLVPTGYLVLYCSITVPLHCPRLLSVVFATIHGLTFPHSRRVSHFYRYHLSDMKPSSLLLCLRSRYGRDTTARPCTGSNSLQSTVQTLLNATPKEKVHSHTLSLNPKPLTTNPPTFFWGGGTRWRF
jgi:hypothetical protein